MCGADPTDVDGAMVSDIEDMDRIINQFLEFSKKDGGEQIEAVDLAGLADELATLYARRGFDIAVRHKGPALALARPQALRRTLTNLIENAINYAGHAPELELGGTGTKPAIHVRSTAAPASRLTRPSGSSAPLPAWNPHAATPRAPAWVWPSSIASCVARAVNFALAARSGGGLDACIELPAAPKA